MAVFYPGGPLLPTLFLGLLRLPVVLGAGPFVALLGQWTAEHELTLNPDGVPCPLSLHTLLSLVVLGLRAWGGLMGGTCLTLGQRGWVPVQSPPHYLFSLFEPIAPGQRGGGGGKEKEEG